MKSIYLTFLCCLLLSCKQDDGFVSDGVGGQNLIPDGCEGVSYPDWETSEHVLPYPVGRSYTVGLGNCGAGHHAEGMPDQFAVDINMSIGTLVTASRLGTIMFVEESGDDYSPTNNVVVLRDEDGYFLHYQHLTLNGALVEVGDIVQKGDPIGFSGASGEAGYPHLHFVATRLSDWMFPYSTTYPITFSNTSANPRSLIQGETYEALPYEE